MNVTETNSNLNMRKTVVTHSLSTSFAVSYSAVFSRKLTPIFFISFIDKTTPFECKLEHADLSISLALFSILLTSFCKVSIVFRFASNSASLCITLEAEDPTCFSLFSIVVHV